MKWMNWSVLVLVLGLLAACGDDSSSKSGDTGNSEQADNNGGSSTSTSFDVKVGETPYKREVPNSDAKQETAAAMISGNTVTLYMVSSEGVAMTAVIETTEQSTAPGTFAVNPPPEGTFVQITDAIAGDSLESISGSIKLSSCPGSVGEKVVGEFLNVQLEGLAGGSKTMTGAFDLAVVAKTGDLFCAAASTNNTTNNTPPKNSGGTCDADMCEGDGVCCPYLPCLTQCQFDCFTTPECFGSDVEACAQCSAACAGSCDVSTECRGKLTDLNTCEEDNQCDALGDEDAYQACTTGNCCSELKAAY